MPKAKPRVLRVPPAECVLIGRGVAARLGIDLVWAFSTGDDGRQRRFKCQAEARAELYEAMAEVMVCPRPMNSSEISIAFGVNPATVRKSLQASRIKRSRHQAFG